MKQFKLVKVIIICLWTYFIIYNTYFGWNMYPQSELEKHCDKIFSIGIQLAIGIYLLPLFKIYELLIKKIEK